MLLILFGLGARNPVGTRLVDQPTLATMRAGVVSTFAGSGSGSSVAGSGTAASFNGPGAVVVSNGFAYVGDRDVIEKVDLSSGAVSVFSGTPGSYGFGSDGTAAGSRHSNILAMAGDGQFLYSVEEPGGYSGQLVRTSLVTGVSSTIDSGGWYSGYSTSVTISADGTLYLTHDGEIEAVDLSTEAVTYPAWGQQSSSPGQAGSVAAIGDELYGTFSNGELAKLDPSVGTWTQVDLDSSIDTGSHLVAAGGQLYGSGEGGTVLRRYDPAGGWVNVAGTRTSGAVDGTGANAGFGAVSGIDSDGTHLWVADSNANLLRKVTPASPLPSGPEAQDANTPTLNGGQVSTFAGGSTTAGTVEGTGLSASFSDPTSDVILDGYAYVQTQQAIQRVDLATAQTTLVTPHGGGAITTDGTFLYTAVNNGIVRTNPTTGVQSVVTTFGGFGDASALAVTSNGRLYALLGGAIIEVNPFGDSTSDPAWGNLQQAGASYDGLSAKGSLLYSETNTISSDSHVLVSIDPSNGATSSLSGNVDSDGTNAPSLYDFDNTGPMSAAGGALYGTGDDGQQLLRYDLGSRQWAVVAGLPAGSDGSTQYEDGTDWSASFGNVTSIDTDGTNLWVIDAAGSSLRRVVSAPAEPFPNSGSIEGGPDNPNELQSGDNPSEAHCACQDADPVDTSTGNLHESSTELSVKTKAGQLGFTRSYDSSAATTSGPLGYGWTSPLGMSVQALSGSGYGTCSTCGSMLGAGGSGEGYGGLQGDAVSLDTYQSPGDPGSNFVGVATGGSSSNLNYQDTNTNVPNLHGTHHYVVTYSGGVLSVAMDGTQVISDQITLPRDVLVGFTGGTGGLADGHLVSNANVTGTDTSGVGTTIADPTNGGWELSGNAQLTSDALQLTDANNSEAGSAFWPTPIASDGLSATFDATITNGSGADGMTFTVLDASQYSTTPLDRANVIAVTQQNGSQVEFTRNSNGSYTPPSRVEATLSFDSNGDATFVQQRRTVYHFNPAGDLTDITDLHGNTITYGYNSAGQIVSETGADGRGLTFTYNSADEITRATTSLGLHADYTYDASGNLTSAIDPDGGLTLYRYDTAHRLTSVEDPNGDTTGTTYDDLGRVVSQTDPLRRTTTWTYSSTTTGIWTVTETDPAGIAQVEVYRDYELTSLTKAAGTTDAATWTYAYDPATNQRTKTTNPDGTTTSETVDAAGDPLTFTDADGHTSTDTYDSLGDVLTSTTPAGHTTH
jgi:YD repeat-containing protein